MSSDTQVVSLLRGVCRDHRMASRDELIEVALAAPSLTTIHRVAHIDMDCDGIRVSSEQALDGHGRGDCMVFKHGTGDGSAWGFAIKTCYGDVVEAEIALPSPPDDRTLVRALLSREIDLTLERECLEAKSELNLSIIDRCRWEVGGRIKNPVIGVRKYTSGLIKAITPEGDLVIELAQRGKKDRTLAQIPAVVLRGQPIVMRGGS